MEKAKFIILKKKINMTLFILGKKKVLALYWFGKGLLKKHFLINSLIRLN